MKRSSMDLLSTTQYIENSLNAGLNGFFVLSDIGMIGVEINNSIMYDPMSPVEVFPWVHAPRTQWAMRERYRKASYYMSLPAPASRTSTHLHVVEGIVRCMFHSILGFDPDSRIIDTGIIAYERHNCNKTWTINAIEKEFCNLNLNIITRNDAVVKMLVRDMITRRIVDSEEIIRESKKLLDTYEDIGDKDGFYQEIFGLVLYIVKRSPERIKDMNQELVNLINDKPATVIEFSNIAAKAAAGK